MPSTLKPFTASDRTRLACPRVKHADDIDPDVFDNSLCDDIFAKIIACIRIAVPYTGMIISTRESEAVRGKVLDYGISQISGASRTSVGGYTEAERPHDSEQFDVSRSAYPRRGRALADGALTIFPPSAPHVTARGARAIAS